MRLTVFEKISILLGSLGFLISVVALLVSIQSIKQSEEITQKQIDLEVELRKSRIVLQIGCDYNQEKITFQEIDSDSGRYSAIYKQKYNVLINNIGFVDASITSLNVVHTFRYKNSLRSGWFQGMGPWIYNEEGIAIELPFTIIPNQPRKILLEVGVKVQAKAWKSVEKYLKFDKEYNYRDTEELFLRMGHPFFGQLNKVSENGYGDTGELQQYIISLIKGDGKELSAQIFHNVNQHWIQGEVEAMRGSQDPLINK